jgi:hypothetical protein
MAWLPEAFSAGDQQLSTNGMTERGVQPGLTG